MQDYETNKKNAILPQKHQNLDIESNLNGSGYK